MKPYERRVLPGWVPEFARLGGMRVRSVTRVLGSAVLVGLVAGFGAVLFYYATRVAAHYALGELTGYHPQPRPGGEPSMGSLPEDARPLVPWLLLIVPAVGGLLSGWLVYTFAPEAEGHGTDAVIEAYHHADGYIRPRVPLVKIIASAITMGTGGSGGREGPIAQIGAGFGSFLGDVLRFRPSERRVLTAAGMGAGIAAVFRAPLAGALFAAEVLYWSPEFEAEVIIPAGIASVVSYTTYGAFFGWQPLFAMPDLRFGDPKRLLAYLGLALAMAALGMVYTHVFYGVTDLFRRWKIPNHVKPAIGGLATGAVALGLYFGFGRDASVLSVLSFGYDAVQRAITDETNVGIGLLLAIALGKILTTSLTIGSGGSGGVFGPSMVIGGCGGGAFGLALHHMWPSFCPHPASFVVVGMAGFFAAAAKTPFSTLVIVSEMTGGYHLLLPALWVCVLAYLLADRQSIYRAQLESRAHSPAHTGSDVRVLLANVRVGRFLPPAGEPVPTLAADDDLRVVVARMSSAKLPVLPVTDAAGTLLGIVDIEHIHVTREKGEDGAPLLARDLMRTDVTPLAVNDTLDLAQELFVDNDLLALPVVDDREHRRVVAVIRRHEIASAYLQYVHGRRTSSSGESVPPPA
ncbi:MAG TPA: chloride channel protein [Polyangiaceae bacterium]|jgi:CIC family chloride channel protein